MHPAQCDDGDARHVPDAFREEKIGVTRFYTEKPLL
jgi:hypothetical protein